VSDIERVVLRTRKIERLLRDHYHAHGKGLHQLISSCEERLPHDVIAKLRFVATIRNKVVHEDRYQLEDRKAFFSVCKECEQELTPRSGRFVWRVVISLIVAMTMIAMAFYYVHWEELSEHIK